MPEGFAYVNDKTILDDPPEHDIIVNLKYFGSDNFIGRPMPAYNKNVGIMTKPAVKALNVAQKKFNEKNYTIVLYDSYRPQDTVDYFMEWMEDEDDNIRKIYHYPYVPTKASMRDIYIASKSGHSKGSTVDLSIIKINETLRKVAEPSFRQFEIDGELKTYVFLDDNTIDCGTSFDLMDPMSHPNNTVPPLSDEQLKNRNYIRDVMVASGFKQLDTEWWHYTLVNEPYPDKAFNFPIDEYSSANWLIKSKLLAAFLIAFVVIVL